MIIPYYQNVFILAFLILDSSQQNCLTWMRSRDTMQLTCKIDKLIDAVVFINPNGTEVASCLPHNNFSNCSSLILDSKIIQDEKFNETMFIFPLLDEINVTGSWICKHGSILLQTNVSTTGGMKSDVEVKLKGNVSFVDNTYIFTLSCFSCSNPQNKHAEFQINDKTAEDLMFVDNRCHHGSSECNQTECICSKNSNRYTWIFRRTHIIVPIKFSCSMRFSDDTKSTMHIKYGATLYNGKDFKPIKSTSKVVVDKTDESTTMGYEEHFESNALWIGLGTIILLLVGVICLLIRKKCLSKKPYRVSYNRRGPYLNIQRNQLQRIVDDEDPSYELGEETCGVCGNLTMYAFCSGCKILACETCSKLHQSRGFSHQLVQIVNNIYSRGNTSRCSECNRVKPEYICTLCKDFFCSRCKSKHVEFGHISTIKPLVLITNKDNGASIIIKKHYEFKVSNKGQPVHICGLAVLSDYKIVVADSKSHSILLYQYDGMLSDEMSLETEPGGIAGLLNETVAVTLPSQKKIAIIVVKDTDIADLEFIDTPLGKPLSIAHNKKHLAVEFEEGEDKFIAVLDMKGKILRKTETIENLGLSLGHKIGLALDMNAKRIYVSASEMNEISCIKFNSKLVWTETAKCPWGITIHESTDKHTSIILVSKTCNLLYQINPKSGTKNKIEVAEVDKSLICPRYIAISDCSETDIMAVDLADNIIGFYQILSKD